MDIETFWKEKEAALKAKLVISSFATYLKGVPGYENSLTGLLYVMDNGVYFETFDKHTLIDLLGGKLKKEFQKQTISIPLHSIQDITDLNGDKVPGGNTLVSTILNMFSSAPQGIIIHFTYGTSSPAQAYFDTTEEPYKLIGILDDLLEKR